MDYRNLKAATNTITRDMNSMCEETGNVSQQYHVVRYHGAKQNSWTQQNPRLGSTHD